MGNTLSAQRWLVAWIGRTDHEAAESKLDEAVGPIATALLADPGYSKVYLLTNYPHERSLRYCDWLARKVSVRPEQIDLYDIDLPSPVDYDAIYAQVSKNLAAARLPREDIELTFHLSPGTPAMTVIWIVLARTRFPAQLIQTMPDRSVHRVEFFTDVADAFLPEYLRQGDQRIRALAAGPKVTAPEFSHIVHRSESMSSQIELARRIAAYDVPALILGETGTGKELFAEAIHAASRRASGPYVPVNCGAIAPELANSELYGHVKGAFTGAVRARKGHFEAASGGTLFLDEIGDLPLDTQVRLLRVLQTQEITPVGSSTPVAINVRIVAATHRNLSADVISGRFREDLFHRLAVGILNLPPLRAREGDIELLVDHFLAQINTGGSAHFGTEPKTISKAARRALIEHDWPGNVRELYHTLTRAAIWSQGPQIDDDDVRSSILALPSHEASVTNRPLTSGFNLQAHLDDIKRQYIDEAMSRAHGRKTVAAKLLGLANHQTLGNWMKTLGMEQREAIRGRQS